MKQDNNILTQKLIKTVTENYQLSLTGIHGLSHWARVLDNGLRLAQMNGASQDVVALFALFHDSQRITDARDDHHGRRGAIFANSLNNDLFHLPPKEFEMLYTACELHTDGLTESNITVQTCWDADRLDLGRASIKPDPDQLCTEEAKEHQLLQWADSRAKSRYHSLSLDYHLRAL